MFVCGTIHWYSSVEIEEACRQRLAGVCRIELAWEIYVFRKKL